VSGLPDNKGRKKLTKRMEQEDFEVSSVHRDDLIGEGFDAKGLSDETMRDIAKTMHECILDSGAYWDALRSAAIACEVKKLPKEA
jgi:hypothetical protein